MVIIEICGPSCSGKTILKNKILTSNENVKDISTILPFSNLGDRPLRNILLELYFVLKFPIITTMLLIRLLRFTKISYHKYGSISLVRSYLRKLLIYKYINEKFTYDPIVVYLFDEGFYQLSINFVGFCEELNLSFLKTDFVTPSKIICVDSSMPKLIDRYVNRTDKPRRTRGYSKTQITEYLSVSKNVIRNQFMEHQIKKADISNFSIQEVIQSEKKIWTVSN